ncbi:hypothetical protein AZI86_04420 [Bdellovibrio bacteriovorus]|uniref:Uncharacterized protein n=1 Tax=Bdellovibrio bacteriovorus TaxID=959 RepID=A0A150WPS5_BDEBC|nr:hypothetical protein [Bdellovibrio bacteriovorus]KYG66307.1 hypothetical protein AZI86_04420 [Bdellovibrio bacteriovorus]
MKLLSVLAIGLFSVAAHAGSVNMTCEEARADYNADGRIYVTTGSGDIVPIYGLVQSCPPYGQYMESPYWVRTTDNNTCVLGYRCIDNRD